MDTKNAIALKFGNVMKGKLKSAIWECLKGEHCKSKKWFPKKGNLHGEGKRRSNSWMAWEKDASDSMVPSRK